jgi:hypothetical protein
VSTPGTSGRRNLYARFPYVVRGHGSHEGRRLRFSRTATALYEMLNTKF